MANMIILYGKCDRCGAYESTDDIYKIEVSKWNDTREDEDTMNICLCTKCGAAFLNRFVRGQTVYGFEDRAQAAACGRIDEATRAVYAADGISN